MAKSKDEQQEVHQPWNDPMGSLHLDRALTPEEAAELEQERRRVFLDRRATRFENKASA
jgi:hypothetical protein